MWQIKKPWTLNWLTFIMDLDIFQLSLGKMTEIRKLQRSKSCPNQYMTSQMSSINNLSPAIWKTNPVQTVQKRDKGSEKHRAIEKENGGH